MPVVSSILVEIAPGELIDRMTILQIKCERIADAAKLANVRTELETLQTAFDAHVSPSPALDAMAAELKGINETLWDVEDRLRDCERAQDFGPQFVELARSVYFTNDQRAAVKRRINDLLGSRIVEEKSYAPYETR